MEKIEVIERNGYLVLKNIASAINTASLNCHHQPLFEDEEINYGNSMNFFDSIFNNAGFEQR